MAIKTHLMQVYGDVYGEIHAKARLENIALTLLIQFFKNVFSVFPPSLLITFAPQIFWKKNEMESY